MRTKNILLGLLFVSCLPAFGQINDSTRKSALGAVSALSTERQASQAGTSQKAQPVSDSGVTTVDRPFGATAQEAPLPIAPFVAPPPPVKPVPVPKWEVQIADINLLNTFQRWGTQAGYRIKWDASRHVLVDASGVIEGSFENAVEAVLASPGIRQSEYPLEVCFYANQVARVTRRAEQQKECK